jgi:anti-anti-sigma regulatory factor
VLSDVLACEVAHTPPLAYVTARGRLDPHTAPLLRQSVLKALAAEPAAVLIDMACVTDVDPIALTVFLPLARAAAAWPGSQLIQHSSPPALARELKALAIDRHVSSAVDRADAEAVAGRLSGPVQVRWAVAGGTEGPAEARSAVRTFCRMHGLGAVADNAELVITELVANAVVHGSGPVTAQASVRRRYLHLAVGDRSPVLPRLVGPGLAPGGGGRGLIIVDALTVAWGATDTPDGKIVWCTLRP